MSSASHNTITAVTSITAMHDGFAPGDNDVICGRGNVRNHIGNERFKQMLVVPRLQEYTRAAKSEKSFILTQIVEQVRRDSPHGGFVKQRDDGMWYEVGDFAARERVSQAFRDLLSGYKSSSMEKKKRRMAGYLTAMSQVKAANAARAAKVAPPTPQLPAVVSQTSIAEVSNHSTTSAESHAQEQQATKPLEAASSNTSMCRIETSNLASSLDNEEDWGDDESFFGDDDDESATQHEDAAAGFANRSPSRGPLKKRVAISESLSACMATSLPSVDKTSDSTKACEVLLRQKLMVQQQQRVDHFQYKDLAEQQAAIISSLLRLEQLYPHQACLMRYKELAEKQAFLIAELLEKNSA